MYHELELLNAVAGFYEAGALLEEYLQSTAAT